MIALIEFSATVFFDAEISGRFLRASSKEKNNNFILQIINLLLQNSEKSTYGLEF